MSLPCFCNKKKKKGKFHRKGQRGEQKERERGEERGEKGERECVERERVPRAKSLSGVPESLVLTSVSTGGFSLTLFKSSCNPSYKVDI